MGKQHIGADTVELEQFARRTIPLAGHGQQQMLGLDLPAVLLPGLPGRQTQELPGLLGQPLGQREVRGSRAVEQLGHGLRQLRVHPQLPQHHPRPSRFPGHGQQQMDRAHIAVTQASGFSGGVLNQIRRQGMISHIIPPCVPKNSRRFRRLFPKKHRQPREKLFIENLKKGIAFSKIHATMKLRYYDVHHTRV